MSSNLGYTHKQQVPLSSLTTFQNEGAVNDVFIFHTLEALKAFIQLKKPFHLLGKGSNSLLSPNINMPIIQLAPDILPVQVQDTLLTLNGGLPVHKVMAILQEHGLSGLEFAAGVPASIGGMVAMNFGCWGKDMSQILVEAHILDENAQDFWLPVQDLQFGYRSSLFHKKQWILLEAKFQCKKESPEWIKKAILQNIQMRVEKQPLKSKTFGSTFKNPPQHFAAQLLEENGFKNKSLNAVKFSEQHANFMVNMGQGTFEDCICLIESAIETVKKNTGIELEPEVKIIT